MMDYETGSQQKNNDYTKPHLSGFHGPINIGNPHEVTIKEIAQKVVKLAKSKSKIVYEDLPEDDPKKRCPDITKAKKFLDWTPKVALDEGLKKTIKYFKNLEQ